MTLGNMPSDSVNESEKSLCLRWHAQSCLSRTSRLWQANKIGYPVKAKNRCSCCRIPRWTSNLPVSDLRLVVGQSNRMASESNLSRTQAWPQSTAVANLHEAEGRWITLVIDFGDWCFYWEGWGSHLHCGTFMDRSVHAQLQSVPHPQNCSEDDYMQLTHKFHPEQPQRC